jgi:hypothetical protein
MLIQLKKDKHGAPHVDNEDVPPVLRSTTKSSQKAKKESWDTDGNWFKRWDWVMDEMIWSFTELNKPDWTDQFYTGKIDHIWVKKENGDYEWKIGPKHTFKFNKRTHDKHYARIQNGLKLFGKYYMALWD